MPTNGGIIGPENVASKVFPVLAKTTKFLASGNFIASPTAPGTVTYVVVAGGGGGGGDANATAGAGGGAGGYRTGPMGSITGGQSYPVTVGAAGSRGDYNTSSTPGANSIFAGSSTITSTGGGHGAHSTVAPPLSGSHPYAGDGGSGGGSTWYDNPAMPNARGAGNTPPVSPSQGNNGGESVTSASPTGVYGSGGGGGASAVGATGDHDDAGNGGAGSQSPISGAYYSGGGGGGANTPGGNYDSNSPGLGGIGGGGAGGGTPSTFSSQPGNNGEAGTTNTGGGGGGVSRPSSVGGHGGSGVVEINEPEHTKVQCSGIWTMNDVYEYELIDDWPT